MSDPVPNPAWITDNDRERSATATHLSDLVRALEPLRDRRVERLLDVGCGYGGLTRFVGAYLSASELHGVDEDRTVLEEARAKGILARRVDVSQARLPYPDRHFDLVVSFGMMDYLPTFDGLILDIHRVLRSGGDVLIALPNLASWHNRLALLLGYQPRDVEISRAKLTGLMPWYRVEPPTGHIHTSTVRAFSDLMEYHGFQAVRIIGGRPGGRKKSPLLEAIDSLLSTRVTLARRYFYLGRKR